MKTLKKSLAFLLALSMVFTLFVGAELTASAKTSNGYFYSVKDGKAIIEGGTVTGDVKFPTKLGGYTVTAIADRAFYRSDPVGSTYTITSVYIPATITSIGGGAFGCCQELNAINVDKDNPNYSSIDGVLFNKKQTKLICYPYGKGASYVIPDGVTTIESCAFLESWLSDVVIPVSVKKSRNKGWIVAR